MITPETPQWKIIIFVIVSLSLLVGIMFTGIYYFARYQSLVATQHEEFNLPIPTIVQTDPLINPAGPLVPPIESIDPVLGNPYAPVTIIYFADFSCPFCHEMKDVWQQVLDEYGDDIRIVWKDLLLYESSLGLHKGARCAQLQGVFWPYYNEIWNYDFSSGQITTGLMNIAKDLDLDTAFFAQCIASTEIEQVVFGASHQTLSVGIGSAPSYFINDNFYEGFKDIEEIRAIIDAELAK